MTYLGELISIGVAFSWTAQCAPYGIGTDIFSIVILGCSWLIKPYNHTR